MKIHDIVYRHSEHHNSLYHHTLAVPVYTNIYCNDWVVLRNVLATFAARFRISLFVSMDYVCVLILLLMYFKYINPLNTELNTICYFLILLGVHPLFHISRIRVKYSLYILIS